MISLPIPNINVSIGKIVLNNPLVLASGVMGTSPTLLERIALAGAGAVTAKSCGPEPRVGHPNPVMAEWEHGLITMYKLQFHVLFYNICGNTVP